MNFYTLDAKLIRCFRRVALPLARTALFLVYFWFGILKVFDLSPATPLVQHLFEQIIPFMTFGTFLVCFGIFECIIGVLFLIRGFERTAIIALFLHLITTAMPLILLPQEMWSGVLVPTMEGQYVIKNILIISAAVFIGSRLVPFSEKK